MVVVEVILLGSTFVLAVLTYLNYTQSSRILKQTRTHYHEIDQLHEKAQQRYLEILRARDKVIKEGERIASFWYAERLN